MNEPYSPITTGHMYWVWREELPWLIGQIRNDSSYTTLRDWADNAERWARRSTDLRYQWGMSGEHPFIPLFDRLTTELDASRTEREDGTRILPLLTDGKRRWHAPLPTP